jgi:hypothetical protein
MEIAASALTMEALHKDGSSRGAWQGGINKDMAASVTDLMTRYRVPPPQQAKQRRITQVGIEGRGIKTAEDDNDG